MWLTWLVAAAMAPTASEGEELTAAIVARDAEFFQIVFDACDPVRVRAMLTPDFEMYHDKGGVIARSAEDFIKVYTRDCEARQTPGSWRSRRALLQQTLIVDPVPGFGAIAAGEHLFYERRGNGPETLAGRAKFTHLWEESDTGWRLSRVMSFDHRQEGGTGE